PVRQHGRAAATRWSFQCIVLCDPHAHTYPATGSTTAPPKSIDFSAHLLACLSTNVSFHKSVCPSPICAIVNMAPVMDMDLFWEEEKSGSRLFIGTQGTAKSLDYLTEKDIKRVIVVGSKAYHPQSFQYLVFGTRDMERENLLERFDECLQFIDEGIAAGENLLIHCVFGQSRSATVATAFLMRKRRCKVVEAIAELSFARPKIHINVGFLAQLLLYEELGYRLPMVDSTNDSTPPGGTKAQALFRWFVWAQNTLGAAEDGGERGNGRARQYRCFNCRQALFSEMSVVPHDHPLVVTMSGGPYEVYKGRPDFSFKYGSSIFRPRAAFRAGAAAGGGPCTSIFVEPLEWMGLSAVPAAAAAGGATAVVVGMAPSSGKLCCPKCSAKLGAWDVSTGLTCSCGGVVRPGVQVVCSKVELGL
ncbi:unnamed protein product, partial [Phaeothamnion confervicola]